MSLSFLVFVVVFLTGVLIIILLLWAVFTLAVWLVRRAMKLVRTEQIGTVVQHAYSQPRSEDEWVVQFADAPDTPPWTSMTERPVVIHRNVPALPHVCIHLANGSRLWCECTVGEYDVWTDGTIVQIDVYAFGDWAFYTSEPKLVARTVGSA